MKGNFDGTSRRVLAWTALAAALFGSALPVRAQGLEEPFREPYLKALQGKVVAYLPVAMSFDLAQGWLAGIKRELEPLGVKIVVRDPNWSTNAGAQALTNLISEKPDVIIAHNPDVQTYAKLLQKAESSGIDVVQINMRSSYPTTVFVGADWIEIGRKATTAVVDFCKGKSNKIAIIQGQLSAAASAYTLKGVEDVLAKHSDIKVVSSQAADWDASKAKGITQTVLRAERRLRPGQERIVRSRSQLRRSDPGEQHGGDDQVAAGLGSETRVGQGLDLYDAHPDYQGQRGGRRYLLDPQQGLTQRPISLARVTKSDSAHGRATGRRRNLVFPH